MTIEDAARAASEQLQVEMPDGFVAGVEAVLTNPQCDAAKTYMDPATAIGLGSLLVSAVGLAWQIYSDLKKVTPEPAPKVIERKVRMRIVSRGVALPDQADRIIEVAVHEVIARDPS